MKSNFFFAVLLSALCMVTVKGFSGEVYQLTVYHFTDASQEITLDTYLQTALLPALHRQQIKNIGIFKPIANDTATNKMIYVIVPFKSLNDINGLQPALDKDAIYLEAGKSYLMASYKNPPYSRMEKILLTAFENAPLMQLPTLNGDRKNHVYELRSYEGPTENYYRNKVKMFNAGDEIGIFAKLNFNAVFYGDVIAGNRMPNLMYLTSFDNMDERNKHWKSFTDDADVKKLFALDEYKNNVSKSDIILMRAASYSDY